MLNTRLSPWPSYSEEEVEAVAAVLRSNRVNYWTGTESREFEKEFAAYIGSRHAIALGNGTLALDLALHVLGIGAGDEVIVTSRTFLASASSIINAGAVPVFVDVDRDSQNITADTIAPAITPRTKGILCVHLAGWPCDMDPIMALAKTHNLYVIEDCAQAHGAKYKGRHVGTIGHMGAWSFCQDKIMTTGGEGGMLTMDNTDWWKAAWAYKDHGKSYDAVYEKQHPPGFRWLHESFGTNWRITEMQSAIGRIQLRRLDAWKARRQALAAKLDSVLRQHDVVRVPSVPADIEHAEYKHYAFVRPERLREGWTRDAIIEALTAKGVPAYQGSCSEVYLEKAFDNTGWRPEVRLPVARELGETSLMFLVHPTLTDEEMAFVCRELDEVLTAASR
ncbi:aminotransferase [Pandoraea pnomenusa]|uniref:L-glutamine:2-deoxy-scyllo-inosose aminotransferase n=1 Tax=Pandoraea pnomenusa TaxID=93220 RepID=A0A378YMT9_9BURK|nr:DegT/DnrJ/EryC1/StrS family aminotransferase [Pandoraea pnomenusa]AIU27406.1 aminotransferase [Pandoraea pnomenusa]MBN9093564.1 DegT/DnrJ/EryC1/StrS family aminotransferase [Pandoraea pnomenusa]QDX23771.1 DegT/DnrJ/EryC1/StrS family aminotransferase [Pandoraea pnomenusa]SUA78515.1 L-glutamine:2-deoxy-scyllo-inosose aminotransferase [Pandoraea pnomenusa]